LTQHGYGNVNIHATDPGIGWEMGGLYPPGTENYNFLDYGTDYPRETNIDLALYTEYRIPYYGVKFYAELAAEYTRNKRNVKGENEWKYFLTLSAKWQAY
ncbi:MAG: hypothetical protein FWF38_05500, partial [Spirochaetaceae bacterium]|nr:hypothetical protein [Spirochaetaceae bacterium]